ncbi:hypothetical protein OPV22_014025 [Ensete ventricosum]|uniref:Uncharacterized protein n=1 Tax=Ensete ventricosum TaxID=4639 RepID=A0AAV8PPF9_ENSVE|nr:hypothetical protein OPV22_014025 [Ensete ventricosum]
MTIVVDFCYCTKVCLIKKERSGLPPSCDLHLLAKGSSKHLEQELHALPPVPTAFEGKKTTSVPSRDRVSLTRAELPICHRDSVLLVAWRSKGCNCPFLLSTSGGSQAVRGSGSFFFVVKDFEQYAVADSNFLELVL